MLLMHYLQDVLLVFATIQGIFLLSHLYFSQDLVKEICKYFSFYVQFMSVLSWYLDGDMGFITISNGEHLSSFILRR